MRRSAHITPETRHRAAFRDIPMTRHTRKVVALAVAGKPRIRIRRPKPSEIRILNAAVHGLALGHVNQSAAEFQLHFGR